MPKRFLLLVCTLWLGGCALPVPVQIASWAVDGLLYITTEKTMADHGVSLVAQRDCAMLRVVTEGTLCRDDAATQIAAADGMTPPATTDAFAHSGDDTPERLASFETAAGEAVTPKPSEAKVLESARPELDSQKTQTHWQAILDLALFLDRLTGPTEPEAGTIEAFQGILGWSFVAPQGFDDTLDIRRHVEGISVGDSSLDPYMDGTNFETIMGGADNDTLGGGSANGRPEQDRSPAPLQGHAWPRAGPDMARMRPQRRRADPRSSKPPDRRPRRARVNLLHDLGKGPGP